MIKTETKLITPADATEMLTHLPPHQRPIRRRKVDEYARTMTRGEWGLNGEAIIFDAAGQLINGQHRLAACVQAGVSFPTIVTTGVGVDSYATLDSGLSRMASDALATMGVERSVWLAAAAKIVGRYERVARGEEWGDYLTNAQTVKVVLDHPGLADSLTVTCSEGMRAVVPASMAAFAHYYANQINPEMANSFIKGLETGANLEPGDARLLLRTNLINARALRKRSTSRDKAAIFVKAVNMHLGQRRGLVLKFSDREPFPLFDGLAEARKAAA